MDYSEMHLIQGGGFCAKAGGVLAGVGIGAAGLTYFGIITVATGGTAGILVVIAGAGLGVYSSTALVEYRDPNPKLTRDDFGGMSF